MNLLEKISVLEADANQFGFSWENSNQIMAQILSECHEVAEHLKDDNARNHAALQEEIGDLLHAVFSLCVFCKFAPQDTLAQTLNKFERRLQAVKAYSNELGHSHLNDQSFAERMRIWDEAKERVG